MSTTTKIYQIQLDLGQSQQQLDTASKALGELKNRAAAANQEAKEAKQVYDENTQALRALTAEQKQLIQAQKAAPAGEAALRAAAALDKNVTAQQRLNSIVQESRIDYQAAKQAAEAAGAAVGQQAATVKELAASVKQYQGAAQAAAKEFAPGTFGAIGQEVEALKAELQHLTEGSAEAAAKIQQIGEQESKLRGLAQALQASNPEAQAKAFGILTGALTGTVGVVTTLGQVFGLSSATAQEYTQRMQQLTGVLASVDGVSKLLNGENLSLVKSIVASGKAWLTAAEGASTGAKITRAALISTGIGAVVALVGTLIALWVQFGDTVSSSESTFTKFKAGVVGGFEAMIAGGKDLLTVLWDLASFDFAGAAATASQAGKDVATAYRQGAAGVVADAHRQELQAQIDQNERLLKINQAGGYNTVAQERQLLEQKIAVLKQGTEEEKKAYGDAVAELAAFNKAQKKKAKEEAEAETLARLNGILGLEQAAGKQAYQAQLDLEQQKLRTLQAAAQPEKVAIEAQQSVLAALKIAHEKEVNEKLFAARQAALEGRIALEQQKGEDAFALQLQQEEKLLAHLRAAGTQDAAAIQQQLDKIALLKDAHAQEFDQKRRQAELLASQNKLALLEKEGKDTLGLRLRTAELLLSLDKDSSTKERTQREADYQALLVLQAEYNAREKALRLEQQQQGKDIEEAGKQAERDFIKGGLDYTTQVYTDSLAKQRPDLGLKLIKAFFGVDSTTSEEAKKQAEELKQAFTDSFGQLYQAGQQVASAFLDAAVQQNQQALTDAQARLQAATEQLSQLQSTISSDESKLANSQGAARQYYLEKLEKERAEVGKIAGAKAAAAREEKAQLAQQHRLQKIGLELSAATTLAANVAAAAKAVDAGVTAVAGAAALPFPANIPAIIAAVAAVAAAVASAKSLATAVKYEAGTGALGSDGVLRGPRHAQGGIPFTVAGVPGFEAEGGEAITPRDASARNAPVLAMLRTEGRARTLGPADYMRALAMSAYTTVVNTQPPPASYLEAGGILNRGGAPAGGYASAADVGALASQQQRTNAYLAQLVGNTEATANNTARAADHAAKTADNTDEIKRKPTGGGPRSHDEIMREQEYLAGIEQARGFATL
ncbi:hypothetical protein [Hymenobacter cheonanensis]|uniref:hypothetical protein n=1 Tax=Hymenobacter sp. CA2-7 TaxID=3063993 RepID=UPI00271272B9|nr:hypothetical protein [Hymenobacter sp. CA2-7]MDO7885993.1 hypothetical protein [Hymenobacter sp. CA2-7]